MKKTIIAIIASIWGVFSLQSCIDDTSTYPDKPISTITVSAPSDSVSVDFGYELVLDPQVTQTMEGMALNYEWGYCGYTKNSIGIVMKDSLKLISKEKVLKYSFKKLGDYELRLRVYNDHGSTFKFYKLFVKAAFNEGIFVLSADDQTKKGRVSFMRPLSREEAESGKQESFYTDAFGSVNPEYPLNDPTDAEKVGADIFILSRVDNLMYRINASTFEMYNVTDFKTEFSWMKPVAICSRDKAIPDLLILSQDGLFSLVNYKSDIAYSGQYFFEEEPGMNKVYGKVIGEPIPPATSTSSMHSYHFFINYDLSRLYSVYDCYDYATGSKDFPDEEIINVVMDKNKMSCVVTRSKTDPTQFKVVRGYAGNYNPMGSAWEYKCKASAITLTREAKMQSNDKYSSVFYNQGNKMYRWFNWNTEPELPEKPVITLNEKCEITCFNFSQDAKYLYLGVYDSRLPDLKGCVYVYDADAIDLATGELQLIKVYDGVADRPVKVFYKNNRK